MTRRRLRSSVAATLGVACLLAGRAEGTFDDDPAGAMAQAILSMGLGQIDCEETARASAIWTALAAKQAKPDGDGLIDVQGTKGKGLTSPHVITHGPALRAVGPENFRYNSFFPVGKAVSGFVTGKLTFFATPDAAPVTVGAGVMPATPGSKNVNTANVTVFGPGFADETTSVPVTLGAKGSSIDITLSFDGTDVSVTATDVGAAAPTPQLLKKVRNVATPTTPHGQQLDFRPLADKAHVYSGGSASDRKTTLEAALAPFEEAIKAEVDAILLIGTDVAGARAKVKLSQTKIQSAIDELAKVDAGDLLAARIGTDHVEKATKYLKEALEQDDKADSSLGIPNAELARKQLVAALKKKCKAAAAIHGGKISKLCNEQLKKLNP